MIKNIEIRAISHATEDEEKVEKALHVLTSKRFRRLVTYGHYGQRIVVLQVKIGGVEAEEIFERLVKDLGSSILEHIGESEIRLRIDKQEAYSSGKIALTELPDYILVNIRFSSKSREKLVEHIKKIVLKQETPL